MVAAHPSWSFGTKVRVTNLENDRTAVVEIIDRGPVDSVVREGVIIDLSRGVARELAFIEDGRVRVQLDVLE
ncbi:MAG: septal ring lytic transglycosylase RlpA family protein, partial [Vicinamibacteria bacterium]